MDKPFLPNLNSIANDYNYFLQPNCFSLTHIPLVKLVKFNSLFTL